MKNDELLSLRTSWKFLDALASKPPRLFQKPPNFSAPSRTLGLTLLTALACALALPNAHAQSRYTVTDLGDASQVTATCLNNRSDVAGQNHHLHAWLYRHGQNRGLGVLSGGTSSSAAAINDLGQVVGFSSGNYFTHAFLYDGAQMRDLGTLPGGTSSLATGINAWGQVAGYSDTATPNGAILTHAFLYSNGRMLDLGTLPGDGYSFASGINDQGQVIGISRRTADAGVNRAFLYHCGKMRDLTALLPSGSGWVLAGATAINNLGQILVFGTDGNGQDAHNLLLTPTRD